VTVQGTSREQKPATLPGSDTGTAQVVTILGAGAMGSALATPLRARGHHVRLWGTWLDDDLLNAIEAGGNLRTNVPVPAGTALYRVDQLADALEGAGSVIIAVASAGVEAVVARVCQTGFDLSSAQAALLTSKGFARKSDGTVHLLTDAVRSVAAEYSPCAVPLVGVAGPCMANEVAASRPTAAVFASHHRECAEGAATLFATATYQPVVSDDEVGLEVSAALKNVYAIALGFADGLSEASTNAVPYRNLKSALFSRAIFEMSLITRELGGQVTTVYGLPGVGDLEVTGLVGRNKVFGSHIGGGQTAGEALSEMEATGQVVEGVPATRLATALTEQRLPAHADQLPLLHAIAGVVDEQADPYSTLVGAALTPLAPGSDSEGIVM